MTITIGWPQAIYLAYLTILVGMVFKQDGTYAASCAELVLLLAPLPLLYWGGFFHG